MEISKKKESRRFFTVYWIFKITLSKFYSEFSKDTPTLVFTVGWMF